MEFRLLIQVQPQEVGHNIFQEKLKMENFQLQTLKKWKILKIFLKSKKPIKTIVKDALLIKNGNTIVYVIENNIAKLKAVKTGTPYQDSIEIIKGLNEQRLKNNPIKISIKDIQYILKNF